MKKFFLSIISLGLIIFAFSGCVNDIANTSENVEHVFASFVIAEKAESNDRLRSTAELAYTKINITPKGSITVKAISFDAKLKSGQQDFNIILNLVESQQDNKIELAQKTITVTDAFTTINIDLSEPYLYSFNQLDNKINNKDVFSIEFYKEDGQQNSTVIFSINNVILISE